MNRIGTFIATHPKRVLALTGVVTLIAVASLFRLTFNADVASFITEGNERGEAFAALNEKYETADPVNVVLSLADGERFTDRDNLITLAEFRDEIAAIDGVASVAALVPEVSPLDGSRLTPDIIAIAPDTALQALVAGPLTGLLLSENAQHTMLLVVPSTDGIALAGALRDVDPPTGMAITLSGNPTVYAEVIWTFGLIALVGKEVDIVTVIVPIFVLVMGSADGLHFVTHFQDVSRETSDKSARVISTLREVGIPMILTTISTAVGFLSLFAADVRPIQQLGLFAAIGIGFAGVISFFTLPALMTKAGVSEHARGPLLGNRVTRGLRWLVMRRWTAVALVGAVVVFAAVFIPRLEVDTDPLFYFDTDHEVRQAFEQTEELFGGATPLIGEFAFDPSDPQTSLATAALATAELEALPGVRSVFSVVDLAAALPPSAVEGVMSGSIESPIGGLVSSDGLRFMLLPDDFTADDLRGWLDFAESSDDVTIITGLPVLWDELARLILGAQIWSVIAALALLTIMLLLAYRKLRPTIAALVPLVLTIAALLGFIAAADIQLNLITAVASSIVIGVGIDYAIHFVAAIDHARERGPGYVLRAIDRAGRPIAANALGIAIALTALWLSPLRPHHQISAIMWVSMTVAALGALLVIPALLPREGVVDDV
jgi:predicted RND superfamily exporter protein